MYKAFITEDEYPARLRVKKLLGPYSDEIELVGEADNGNKAIEQIEELRPDLLFLDIQLPDMTGFEMLAKLTYQPLVIFTTAYEAYAIKAFETYSIDYLVKPFDAQRFKKAIEKLRKFGQQKNPIDYKKLETLLAEKTKKTISTSLPIKMKDRILLIEHTDICFLKAEDKYVQIFTESGQSYLSDQSLGHFEKNLPDPFIRVHRSYIVNRSCIGEIRKYFRGKLILIMKDKGQTSIKTGGTYSAEVKGVLGV